MALTPNIQQIFNVAEAQSESKIQPDRLLNDAWGKR
jgi:hypothetical protein